MISFLITAYKEEKTIAKVLSCLVDSEYSGYSGDFEVLLACPDPETLAAAMEVVEYYNLQDKFVHIQDPHKGKPVALNLMLEQAKGNVWIFTDGDVWFEKNAVSNIVRHFDNEATFAVTGRPASVDLKTNFMGYMGHLLADAANHKRTVDLTENATGKSLALIKKRSFFPVSGYIYATRRFDYKFPDDCLVDDAYISYLIFNEGKKIEYEPDAIAYVKYPTTLKDYYKQKRRSVGGFTQLWKYGVVSKNTKTRTFWRELEYFWFPIRYAKNLKELFFSLMMYPVRLWLWIQIFVEQKVLKKDLMGKSGWARIESTK